jgi:hypothetical protein
MYHLLNVELAMRLGTHTALVAQVLYDETTKGDWAQVRQRGSQIFIRASYRMLAAVIPYVTYGQVRRYVRDLMELGIIQRAHLSDSPFDHSGWYAFTPAGDALMRAAAGDGESPPALVEDRRPMRTRPSRKVYGQGIHPAK